MSSQLCRKHSRLTHTFLVDSSVLANWSDSFIIQGVLDLSCVLFSSKKVLLSTCPIWSILFAKSFVGEAKDKNIIYQTQPAWSILQACSSFYRFFFFFFFFSNLGFTVFQDYFAHFEPSQSWVRAKTGDPPEKPSDNPQAELGLSHMWSELG